MALSGGKAQARRKGVAQERVYTRTEVRKMMAAAKERKRMKRAAETCKATAQQELIRQEEMGRSSIVGEMLSALTRMELSVSEAGGRFDQEWEESKGRLAISKEQAMSRLRASHLDEKVEAELLRERKFRDNGCIVPGGFTGDPHGIARFDCDRAMFANRVREVERLIAASSSCLLPLGISLTPEDAQTAWCADG